MERRLVVGRRQTCRKTPRFVFPSSAGPHGWSKIEPVIPNVAIPHGFHHLVVSPVTPGRFVARAAGLFVVVPSLMPGLPEAPLGFGQVYQILEEQKPLV